MRFGRIFMRRMYSLLWRSRAEADLRREIDLHVEQLTKEYTAARMSETEARLTARREFGPIEVAKEHCRDMRQVNAVEDVFRGLAYAFRLLRKSPGFTATAVLSLAFGIGANTAIFSLVDAVLLRMLPVREPQHLVEITRLGGGTLSYPFFETVRDRNQVFSGVLLLSEGRMAASAHRRPVDLGDIHMSPVSGGYFKVLGVSPAIGRVLAEEDLDASNVAVISYGFWQRAFAVLNEAMAHYCFGVVDPVRRTFQLESSSFPTPLTVVGLAQNAKYHSLKEAPVHIIYLPALQTTGPFGEANIAVRTMSDPAKMADLLWKAAHLESQHLRFGGFTTQERLVGGRWRRTEC